MFVLIEMEPYYQYADVVDKMLARVKKLGYNKFTIMVDNDYLYIEGIGYHKDNVPIMVHMLKEKYPTYKISYTNLIASDGYKEKAIVIDWQ